jgi:uncharacterized protein YbjT (DUF2867 family)
MYVVTGITGQVGGVVARALLADGKDVRAVVRNAAKADDWARQGCEIAVADMRDAPALQQAFADAEAVFILLPPTFDPSPGFGESREVINAVHRALENARPSRVTCISTVGAQAQQESLLSQLGLLEKKLRDLSLPIAFLRPAWFMENAAWDVASARDRGVIQSFLYPLDKPIPMVATADVGRTAAKLLQEQWIGHRVVELEGPHRISPNDLAAEFSQLLGRSVRAEIVPRETWRAQFLAQGMKNPEPRIRMLDGFNEGWITFEHEPIKGRCELDGVLRSLIERSR